MDDNNEKFIIGDNTEGYRRSNVEYDLDLFSDPIKREQQNSGGKASAGSSASHEIRMQKRTHFSAKRTLSPCRKRKDRA